MKNYKTIEKEASIEVIIDKSRFIGYAKPITTREEGQEFIEKIKRMHKDATHNVPAIVTGDSHQFQWASDDGEPQGTSGPPILQMLVQEGVTDIAIVVTRYFGGIKLGTGGLVRAYTSAAKKAIEAGRIVSVEKVQLLEIDYPYTLQGKIEGIFRKVPVTIEETIYLESVQQTLILEIEEKKKLTDMFEAFIEIKIVKDEVVYRGR